VTRARRCIAVAGVLGGLVLGCSQGGSEDRLRRGDRLITAMISDPKTFNPLLTTDSASSLAVSDLFDTLVRVNPRTTLPEPMLAERWEYDASGTVWTFHLRRDVRWHDGTPFTAADVAFTLEAIYHPKVPNSLKHILIAGGQPFGVEVVDPHTVRLRLAEPFAPLLNSIGFAILPKHLLGEALAQGTFAQRWGIDTPPAEIVGTGPYRLARYEPAQLLQYQRTPDYWMRDDAGGALPRLPERAVLIVPDQNATYLKFLDRQLHTYTPRPEEIEDLRGRATDLSARVDEIGLDTGMLFVAFNRNPAYYAREGKSDPRLTWFSDPRFLRAVAHSIDKPSMIRNAYYGYGQDAVSTVSPENKLFYNPNLPPYPYDLAEAERLLAEGGYVDRDGDGVREDAGGNRLAFDLSTNSGNLVRERLCAILKEDWSKLGFEVSYRPLDFATLVERLQVNYEWDAMVMGFTGGIEPHNGANLLRSSGNLHLWHPNQPEPATEWEAEIDRAIEAGAKELDLEKRRRHYWRIQEILHRELPLILLVRQQQFIAYKTYLTDYAPTVWGLFRPELIAIRP
jgi:peptide/nickel transport system substrate-binding protein